MSPLSPEQIRQIEKLTAKSSSYTKIAKKLHLDRREVKRHLDAVAQQRRHKRERFFRVVTAATPVLFFLILELTLRAFHYGGNLSLFVPAELMPGFLTVNDNVGRRYFSAADVAPETSHELLRAVKSKDAYRVFVLGGSTTAGYPYMYNGSMSKMLYQRLVDYFPEREIEVVNLAMPAINSFSLLDLTDEALAQKPDALVIYCGHNEFYGALGVGSTESLGRWRWVIKGYLQLQRFKTVLFLRDQLERMKKLLHKAAAGGDRSNTTLMEEMVADQQIRYDGEAYKRARKFFKSNLQEIVAAARRREVPVLLSNLVSNLRDQAPFVSVYAQDTDRDAYERELHRGATLYSRGEFTEALAVFDSLRLRDSSPAVVHYQIGRCQEAMGNYERARTAYERARDLDALRFRASTDFNAAIQEVADATGAIFVDMESAFDEASPHRLIGKNLVLEHLHPNVKGYFLMGRELCRTMRDHGLVSSQWDEARARSDSVYWQERGVTALDEQIAHIRIGVLTHNWPFVPRDQAEPFVYQPKNVLEKLAYSAWQRQMTWEKAHVLLAEDYAHTGQLGLAVKEYEALIVQTPYNASPYVRAGLLYTALKDYDLAYDRLIRSIELEPSADAYKVVGAIWLSREQPEKGVPYLVKALQLSPGDGQTLYNLTGAYLLTGEIEKARASLARLERLMPGSEKVQQLKQSLASKAGSQEGPKSRSNGT